MVIEDITFAQNSSSAIWPGGRLRSAAEAVYPRTHNPHRSKAEMKRIWEDYQRSMVANEGPEIPSSWSLPPQTSELGVIQDQ